MPTPAPSAPVCLFSAAAAQRIDATAGVIYGVSVITEGPAKGHGMMIDATTLAQMKSCAEEYEGGLKVKVSRGESHQGDFAEIAGSLKNFRIVGPKLLADLHLLENAPDRKFILEVAEKMPDSFGFSVAFGNPAEVKNGVRYARCAEIWSADLVGEPAANPSGLFSARAPASDTSPNSKTGDEPASKTTHPNPAPMETELLSQITKLIDDKIAAASAALNAKLAEITKAATALATRTEEVAKLSSESADKAALAAVKEFAKTLGQPAGSAAAPSAPPTPIPVKQYEDLVREHPAYAKSKLAAIQATMKAHPTEYAHYLGRVQSKQDVRVF